MQHVMCATYLFIQVDLVLATADLAGIVIHKWELMHLYTKILPTKSHARHRRPATSGQPSPAEHWNLATGTLKC